MKNVVKNMMASQEHATITPSIENDIVMPSYSITIRELLEIYECDGGSSGYLRLVTAFLNNEFSLLISRKSRNSSDPGADSYLAVLGKAAYPSEPDMLFRFFHLLPEICILTDNALHPEKRLKGIGMIITRLFKDRIPFQFLKAAGANQLETVSFCILVHIYLSKNKTGLFADQVTLFLPKSLYVEFMGSLEEGNILLDQRLFTFSQNPYFNDQVFHITNRTMGLLRNHAIELI